MMIFSFKCAFVLSFEFVFVFVFSLESVSVVADPYLDLQSTMKYDHHLENTLTFTNMNLLHGLLLDMKCLLHFDLTDPAWL